MSLDPAMITTGRTPGQQPGRITTDPAASSPLPDGVSRVEVLTLREGDRLIVHVEGAAGLSAGGGEAIGRKVRARLALDDLPFDVPVLVVSPGIRVTVGRPG